MFRGFYLIGDELDGAPAFARGLFGRKIFAERGLAEPARGALGRRRHQIRLAQGGLAVLFVLAAIGLARVAAKLEGADSVTMLLRTIDSEVARVERAAGDGEASLDGIRAVAAGNLLQRMSDIDVSSLETIKAPTSLVSDTDARVERAIAVGYDVVLLQAIHARLLEQFEEVIDLVGGKATTPTTMSEGLRRLQEHETSLRRYERLAELDVQALAGVAHYSLGISVRRASIATTASTSMRSRIRRLPRSTAPSSPSGLAARSCKAGRPWWTRTTAHRPQPRRWIGRRRHPPPTPSRRVACARPPTLWIGSAAPSRNPRPAGWLLPRTISTPRWRSCWSRSAMSPRPGARLSTRPVCPGSCGQLPSSDRRPSVID